MTALFVCTLFLSSTLLFLVQPMIAKMVLPRLGGTPAVWNTCMVFFQATLLLGYLYVHAITRRLRLAQQTAVHAVVVTGSLLALPIAVNAGDPPAEGTPIFWLARVLLASVGLPFFVASTTGPLLQRWFARSADARARDPYFLSVAGNVGSIAALLAYPAGLEPKLRLVEQSWLWTTCYGLFAILMLACIVQARRFTDAPAEDAAVSEPAALALRLRWTLLAFVPSTLMLGLTTFLTTDVAPVPLFWVVPLTLYLASFALVFAKRQIVPHGLMTRLLPLLALVLVTLILFAGPLPPAVQAPLHLAVFFVAAMVCHGELARSRPASAQLTGFYLCMSLGGVLGGVFNALIAPLAFRSVVEYPLAIVMACAMVPAREITRQKPSRTDGGEPEREDFSRAFGSSRAFNLSRALDLGVPIVLGALVFGVLSWFGARSARDPIGFALIFLAPPIACFSLRARPLRFALALGAIMFATSTYIAAHQPVELQGRSYYSVYKVVTDPERRLRMLIHARIVHGAQSLDPARAEEPLTYYHRSGPIGQAIAALGGRDWHRAGVVGLGAGSLAAYSAPGQRWTFYEIDPTIAAMARDPRYFSFLSNAKASVDVVLGDARLSLAKADAAAFDLLVVDAFGSDAIPLHLLTREALQVYARTLASRGVIAFHVSNRYMDLQPLVGDLAADAGFTAVAWDERKVSDEDAKAGKTPSTWVLVARTAADLGTLTSDPRWHALSGRAAPIVWTDDFSNPLSVMRWK